MEKPPNDNWEILPATDERLCRSSERISPKDIESPEVQTIIATMLEIARGERDIGPGKAYMVGLAAPQIGIMKRIIVVDTEIRQNERPTESAKISNVEVLINPEIVEHSEETEDFREGCFSLNAQDGIYGVVPRYKNIKVAAFDRNGEKLELETSGLTARIVQHEIDHLDGIRYYQRMPFGRDLDQVQPEELDNYKYGGWQNWNRKVPIDSIEK